MELAFASYSTNQDNATLVAAEAGHKLRVVRLVITSWAAVSVTLLSNPGPDPRSLTPPLHVGTGQSLVLPLERTGALVTGRGEALGLSSAFQSGAAEFSVAVWYEAVN